MKTIRDNIIKEEGILYFDFTASGLAYKPIEEKILQILKTYGNIHSDISSNAVQTNKYYENARMSLRRTLEISDDFFLFPAGTGATGAIKKLQELIGIYLPPMTRKRYGISPKDRPLVLVGPYEHHSNELSFREGLCEVVRVMLDKNDYIDFEMLEDILKQNQHREIIASFSVASNVTGIITRYKQLYKIVKKYGAILCLDAAASSPYMNVDCNYYDALFVSPHKLLGGVGACGLLVVRKELCKSEIPTFAGGGTVSYVSRHDHVYLDDMEMLENAGTPGILQLIRASLAYELRNNIGLDIIDKQEEELKVYFKNKLKAIEGLTLYGEKERKSLPIFSINIDGVMPEDLAKELSDTYHIQTRSGCSCAGPYGHDLLELKDGQEFDKKPGWLRISIHFTHTKEDIDTLVKALEESILRIKDEKRR